MRGVTYGPALGDGCSLLDGPPHNPTCRTRTAAVTVDPWDDCPQVPDGPFRTFEGPHGGDTRGHRAAVGRLPDRLGVAVRHRSDQAPGALVVCRAGFLSELAQSL